MRGSRLKVLTLTTMVHVQEMSHFIHYSCECVNDPDREIWKIELLIHGYLRSIHLMSISSIESLCTFYMRENLIIRGA